MPKKNQSFFGKIMGGDVTEEEQAQPRVPQEEAYEDVEIEETVAEELIDDEDGEETTEIQPTYEIDEEQPVPVQTTREPKENEEWLADFEGQLNIDMYQTKDNIIIKSTIAGVRPEDIDITVANDMVTIKGSRRKEEKISQEDYFYQECYWGSFTRSVLVPVDIDSENIEADLKDGILTVVVPKAAKAKTKKVKVKGL